MGVDVGAVVSGVRWIADAIDLGIFSDDEASLEVVGSKGATVDQFFGWHQNSVKRIAYQLYIRNVGDVPANNCQVDIYCKALAIANDPVYVDTVGYWRKKDSSSITLNPEQSEWVDIVYIIETNDDEEQSQPPTSRHIEFPSESGMEEPALIESRLVESHVREGSRELSEGIVNGDRWEKMKVTLGCESERKSVELDRDELSRIAKMDFSSERTLGDYYPEPSTHRGY